MAKFETPDMSAFDSEVANDHAKYDGALVKLFENASLWTHSSADNLPIGYEHFVHDARRRLADCLKAVQDGGMETGIARQDYCERRIIMDHLANEFVTLWGIGVHTFGRTSQDVASIMHDNLTRLIRTKMLFVTNDSPLSKHYKAKPVSGADRIEYALPTSEDDRSLARFLAGPNANTNRGRHLLDVFEKAQPFLTQIDDTHIISPLLELRRQIRLILEQFETKDERLKLEILDVIFEDWVNEYSKRDKMQLLSDIEAEVEEETVVSDILEEGNLQVVLEHCFETQLKPEKLSDDSRAKLLRRRPALEHIVYTAIKQNQKEFYNRRILEVVRQYFEKLDPLLADSGHLGLIFLIFDDSKSPADLRNGFLV